jgi:integrase/recombinase XerD
VIHPEIQARLDRIALKRRHTGQCQRKFKFSDPWKKLDGRQRCSCPFYAVGVIFDEKGFERKTTERTSEELAKNVVLHWLQKGSTATLPAEPNRTTVAEAISDYLTHIEKDKEAEDSTLKKYRTLMGQLQAFADWKGYRYIQELGQDAVLEFRRSWEDEDAGYKLDRKRKNGQPLWRKSTIKTAKRQAKILRALFDRCVTRKWITENPTVVIQFKRETGRRRTKEEVKYLTPGELVAILNAVDALPRMSDKNKERLKTLILVMRWAGLRISDAVTLKALDVRGDVLYRVTKKASTPVQIPLPDHLMKRLQAMTPYRDGYLFWDRRTSESKMSTVRCNYTSTLATVFTKAGVKTEGDGKLSHMCRNTFAVDLLEKGVPLETVSLLLGHQSVTTTERYYADFSDGYMNRAEQMVRKTWTLNQGEKLA